MASFWGELRRRSVFRVGIAYLAAAWVLIEVVSTLVSIMNAPGWISQIVVFSAALGFPLALLLAWFYELTPEGVKAAADVEALEPARFMGRKIDFAIIGLLVLAVSFLVVDNYLMDGPAAREPSIAVLPFTNDSAAEEDAGFFAAGMHDELLTRLAKIGSLKVISRTSVLEYRDSPKNTREIGQELGVATILEGGVQRAGDEIRINVQLIDADTDEHLWAETYDRGLTAQNVFAIQSEMAMAIAEALQATLLPEELAVLNELPTQNTEAYDFYLLGHDYMNRLPNHEWTPQAVTMYEQAVDRDPEFTEAWAALSGAHMMNRDNEMAEVALEAALKLAPDLPEVHMARGRYLHGLGEYQQALAAYAIAEQGLPGNASLLRRQANVHRDIGELEQAVSLMARAIDLDPVNAELHQNQAWNYMWLRRYEETERHFERVLEIRPDAGFVYWGWKFALPLARGGNGDLAAVRAAFDNPPLEFPNGDGEYSVAWTAALYQRDYDAALSYLDSSDIEIFEDPYTYTPKASLYGVTYQLAGRPDEAETQFHMALAHLNEALEAEPEDHRLLLALAEVRAGLGERQEAQRLADGIAEQILSWSQAWPPLVFRVGVARLYLITTVLALAQDRDALIAELDTYLAGPGDFSIEGLSLDPRLDFIRDDPEFQALVEKYRRQ